MRIIVRENQIKIIKEDKEEYIIELGYKDIESKGTTVVDDIIEHVIMDISRDEKVYIIGEDRVEVNMIARKIEDKIKMEVEIIHPLEGVGY